ncbi:MAG: hypothetical protein ABIE36_00890 [Candidatus Diapherotrites archaeon]
MKTFVFLYPIPEIINFEIQNHGWAEENGVDAFRQRYKSTLNKCIDFRYRQKGFDINYALFNGHEISDVIEIQQSDKIIEVGLDFETHIKKQPNGEYLYPNQDYILNQLNNGRIIRIAGFHMWDCVEKLAKKAYEIGLDTLVDEDLTEFFPGRLRDSNFRVDKYPTYNPRKYGDSGYEMFMGARKHRPWLWQEY